MNISFDRSFDKSLDKIQDKNLKKRIEKIILSVEDAVAIESIPNLKKMQGFKSFYRIRVGDYRIGVELKSVETVRFLIIAHHKDIYKVFP